MAIKQITTANTFGEWIASTQQLILKYNYVEDTANIIISKADNVNIRSDSVNIRSDVVNIKSDSVNIRSDVVNIKSDSVNIRSDVVNAQTSLVLYTANSVFEYVGDSYNVANVVLSISQSSFNHTNAAYNHANAGYLHANASFLHANASFLHANAAYSHANGAFSIANDAFSYANSSSELANSAYAKVNNIYSLANTANLAIITDDNSSDNNERYILFSIQKDDLLTNVNVASQKLLYNPSTGTIKSNSIILTGNSSMRLPVGNTAQRDAGEPGEMRYNTDEGKFEGYTNEWAAIGGGGGFSKISVLSANSTMNLETLHVITANITLTLPPTPDPSDVVGISNMSGYANSRIAMNGENIMGIAEDLDIDAIDVGFSLVYVDSTRGWVII